MPIVIVLIMMGLLIGVIIHSTQLTKSLKGFKKIHSEIVPLMRDYAQTVQTSFHQIESMKKVSGEIDYIMKSQLPEALKIQKDLEFLVGRSEELADHLELIIRTGRDQEFMTLNQGASKQNSNSEQDELRASLKMDEEVKKESLNQKITKKNKVKLVACKDIPSSDSIIESTEGDLNTSKYSAKAKSRASFKPMVESFFLTKTAKKLLGKDHESAREKNYAA